MTTYLPAIYNAKKLLPLARRYRNQDGRVVRIGCGDSNQASGGRGWDEYEHQALIDYGIAMWGSQLIGPSDNQAANSAPGYGYSSFGWATVDAYTSAPTDWQPYLVDHTHSGDTQCGVALEPYFKSSGTVSGSNRGILYNAQYASATGAWVICPLDARNGLKYNWYYLKRSNGGSIAATNVRRNNASDEVQKITLTGCTTTFNVTFSGQTTTDIAFNAAASAVASALNALSTINASGVAVTGNAGGPYDVTFSGTAFNNPNANVALMTGTANTGTIAIEVMEQGHNTAYTNQGTNLAISFVGETGVGRSSLTLAADSTRTFSVEHLIANQSATITAPIALLYMNAQDPSIDNGFLYQTYISRGGQGLHRYAYVINNQHMLLKSAFFGALRTQCMEDGGGSVPMFEFSIISGVNDRDDTVLSVGPHPTSSGTAAGFYDNLEGIILGLKEVWDYNDWDFENEVFFRIAVSPLTEAGDTDMSSYRTAARDISDAYANTMFVDFSLLVDNFAEAQSFWASGSDSAHLSNAGYYQYAYRSFSNFILAAFDAPGEESVIRGGNLGSERIAAMTDGQIIKALGINLVENADYDRSTDKLVLGGMPLAVHTSADGRRAIATVRFTGTYDEAVTVPFLGQRIETYRTFYGGALVLPVYEEGLTGEEVYQRSTVLSGLKMGMDDDYNLNIIDTGLIFDEADDVRSTCLSGHRYLVARFDNFWYLVVNYI